MKFAALALAGFVAAGCIFACSAFTTTDNSAPPADDAGTASPDAPTACTPVALAQDAPPADVSCVQGRAEDLKANREHCGECNHSCGGAECEDGKCVPIRYEGASTAVAIDGKYLYVGREVGRDLVLFDLNIPDAAQSPYVAGAFTTPIKALTFDGTDLYVSTDTEQSVMDAALKVTPNTKIAPVGSNHDNGVFYPGGVAYYVYPDTDPSRQYISRIVNGVPDGRGPFPAGPVARVQDELYYSKALRQGASIERFVGGDSVIQTSTVISALGANADFVFLFEGGHIIRAAHDKAEDIAIEPGPVSKILVDGDDVFYVAYREDALRSRDILVRVKTCGGRPLVLVDREDARIRDIKVDATWIYLATSKGTYRLRR